MADLRQYSSLQSIRILREVIRGWWGLEVAFADSKGYVLDHADGKIVPSDNEFCRRALFSKEGFKRCNDSVKRVSERLRVSEDRVAVLHQCHLGFDMVAAPIHFSGELAGFLMTSGAYHGEPRATDKRELLASAREFSDAPNEALEAAVDAIPRMAEVELAHLVSLIELGAREVMKVHELRSKAVSASRRPPVGRRFGDMVGESPAMLSVFSLLEKVVESEATVLIHGESGTGKELIARAIHYEGPRADKPFVVQNCSAFNDNLLESTLFGHVRGAFTGAVKDQKGLFETADGGTFFLDEIGDMSAALQVKLLRVLQEGILTPVGSTKPVTVDVRIIAASHKDLTKMVERREFREDLYYRVNVLRISVPALRDRIADLPMLVAHFLEKHAQGGRAAPRISAATLEAMSAYRWPGNIRELENEIERLCVLSGDAEEVSPLLLSPRIREAASPVEAAEPTLPHERGGTLRETVESIEAEVIAQGLVRTHWNKSQLAKELGISRSNLIQKCSYYGLERKN